MKKILFFVAIIMALVIAPYVYADNIAVNDWIKLENGTFGTTNGGEFRVLKSDDGSANGVYTYQNFTTFCLETDEYFSYGSPLFVSDISLFAIDGGSGGSSPDPLDARTAYLYSNFRAGNLGSLTGGVWQYNDIGVNDLQKAVWFIEEEVIGVNNYLVTLANGSGWTDTGNVAVMNLTDGRTSLKQSQLILVSVPEPNTIMLLGFGILFATGLYMSKKDQ